MKRLLIVLGVMIAFFTATAFITIGSENNSFGDGVTTCEIYGADGYIAKVVEKVITPGSSGGYNNSLVAKVELNKKNTTGRDIKVVVQLRNSNNDVIESQTLVIAKDAKAGNIIFDHTGSRGEVYYVTINSASCI